jgi:hypothetical protein
MLTDADMDGLRAIVSIFRAAVNLGLITGPEIQELGVDKESSAHAIAERIALCDGGALRVPRRTTPTAAPTPAEPTSG